MSEIRLSVFSKAILLEISELIPEGIPLGIPQRIPNGIVREIMTGMPVRS